MSATGDGPGPGPDQGSEVERLRAEVDRLSAAVESGAVATSARPSGPRSSWWRKIVVGVCMVLVVLLPPLAVVAIWAHDQISNTDRYVQTVAPLAHDKAVQEAVITRITEEITSRLDIKGVTQEAVDALAARGLPPRAADSLSALLPALDNGVDGFIDKQVRKLVESDEFAQAWETANREAHTQMVAVLTGKTGDAIEVKGNSVQLNLAVVINAVKAKLAASGFELVNRLPTVNAEFTLFQSADLAKAQTGFRLLRAVSRVLPVLVILLIALAVFVSRKRRRTFMVASLCVAGSMLLLGALLNLFRVIYLDAIPTDQLPADAAGAIYDQLVSFIRLNLRAVLVLFLAFAFVAWVVGPEPAPVAVRRGTTRALDVVRHGSDRAGLDTGAFGLALGRYKVAIRAVVLGLVVVLYVMAAHPTGSYIITLLVIAAVILLLVELVARTPATDSVEEPASMEPV